MDKGKYATGNRIGVSEDAGDVTLRTQAEEALLQTGAPQKEILDSANLSCIATDANKVRVLVADDSFQNRMLLQAYLRPPRYLVEIAENGAEAAEKVRTGNYDVVLMDMQMPVMDGYAATRVIRQRERSENRGSLPIIALTANASSGDRNQCLEAGCTGYLSKPIGKKVLFAVIAEHVPDATPSAEPERGPAESAVTVRADPEIADLVEDFLLAMKSRTNTLAQALDARDYKVIRTLGHQMKGEGGTFGFDAISAFGAELEQAASREDGRMARKTVEELNSYLAQVQVVYDHGGKAI